MEPKEEIRQRIDIADLIAEYLTLKPAGSGSFKALCPFHNEKTPSFHISRDKQIWHCFGCDKGGDLFAFVMEMDGMDFPSALRFLGKKAGVEVELKPRRGQNEYDQLRELHVLSTAFYQTVLHKHELGEVARTYIKKRGIDVDLARTFELGCAPDKWDALVSFLSKKGVSEQMMLKAGLAKRSSSGNLIDRFRNRLLIPLHDAQGRVVGYTGRLLGEQGEKTGPKYLNTSETPIYRKSDILYGYHLAKRSMRQVDAAIVVEGNLDVVASHKAGVTHVVASSGTALTQSQLTLLQKQTNHLLMCFDSDSAGFAAAQRGIRLAQTMGFDVDVISIPDDLGKDTDDVVQKDPLAWKKLVEKPIPVMRYYIDQWAQDMDPADPRSKRDFAKKVLQEIVYVQDAVERQHWLQLVADMTGVAVSELKKALQRQKRPEKVVQEPVTAVIMKKKLTKTEKSLRFLIGVGCSDESLLSTVAQGLDQSVVERLSDSILLQVYKSLQLLYTTDVDHNSAQTPIFQRLRDRWQSDEHREHLHSIDAALVYTEATTAEMNADQLRTEVDRHIAFLQTHAQSSRKQQLAAQIRQAEQAGQADRVRELLEEYKSFTC